MEQPKFISASEAAKMCGVTSHTVCAWIRKAKLQAYQTAGGKNLIRPVDLMDFMKRHHMFVPDSVKDLAGAQEGPTSPAWTSPAQPHAPSSLKGKRAVLVVDDLPDARKLVGAILKDLDVVVLEAESGYEAMHILLKHPEVRVVILDLVMPGQLGSSTLEEIRRQFQALPVVVVTAYAPEEALSMFEHQRPDKLITKPYRASDLLNVVKELLPAA